MNANVAGGVGGEDEGSLPQALMAQSLTETVYLGRASFRITHEIEAVQVEEPTADTSTWFAHESAVILKGGPKGLATRQLPVTELAPEAGRVNTRPGRGPRRWWLVVALPVVAFALGMVVAPFAGSSALRRKAERAMALGHAPSPLPIAPPAPVVEATSVAAQAPVTAPAVAPAPVAAPAVVTTLPPSTVAMTPPAETVAALPPQPATEVAAATPEAAQPVSAPTTAPQQGRPAKRHVARKAKKDHPASSETAVSATSSGTPDDAPAAEDATPPVAKKAAPAKWVDPWAN